MNHRPIARRHFLRAAGITLALPALDPFLPRGYTAPGATPDQGGTLLDSTSVLLGSHLGHANRHDCTNIPMPLFGGGFKHAGHLAFDREHNTPAARIFVAMLQRLGFETDEFASGKGRIPGLELA